MARRATAPPSRLGWLPNALTIARLAALPVLLAILIAADGPTAPAAAVAVRAVAVTDYLDGYLARRAARREPLRPVGRPAGRPPAGRGRAWSGLILLDRMHPAGPA